MYIDPPRMFMLFILVFYLFYVFFVDRNIFRNFFVATILFSYLYLQIQKSNKKQQDTSKKDTFIKELEETIKGNVFVYPKIFQVHKPPTSLKYTKKTSLADLLYNLRKIRIYDDVSFINIVVLTEYFLKIHFNVMLGKYDARLYRQVLYDIYEEICNIISATTINLPNTSTVTSVPTNDMHEYHIQEMMKYKATLRSYMKAIEKKFQYEKPYPSGIDPLDDDQFQIN